MSVNLQSSSRFAKILAPCPLLWPDWLYSIATAVNLVSRLTHYGKKDLLQSSCCTNPNRTQYTTLLILLGPRLGIFSSSSMTKGFSSRWLFSGQSLLRDIFSLPGNDDAIASWKLDSEEKVIHSIVVFDIFSLVTRKLRIKQ